MKVRAAPTTNNTLSNSDLEWMERKGKDETNEIFFCALMIN